MSFDTILIVGAGLIGSSVARAAKQKAKTPTVLIADASAAVVETVERLGFADGTAEGSAHHFAAKADLVLLCVPLCARTVPPIFVGWAASVTTSSRPAGDGSRSMAATATASGQAPA